jgi:hypothetical protein
MEKGGDPMLQRAYDDSSMSSVFIMFPIGISLRG